MYVSPPPPPSPLPPIKRNTSSEREGPLSPSFFLASCCILVLSDNAVVIRIAQWHDDNDACVPSFCSTKLWPFPRSNDSRPCYMIDEKKKKKNIFTSRREKKTAEWLRKNFSYTYINIYISRRRSFFYLSFLALKE